MILFISGSCLPLEPKIVLAQEEASREHNSLRAPYRTVRGGLFWAVGTERPFDKLRVVPSEVEGRSRGTKSKDEVEVPTASPPAHLP